jgi:hypothetical protein
LVSVPEVVLKETECEGLNWLLALDRDWWRVVVNTVVDIQFASKIGNFPARWANVSLWRRPRCYKFFTASGYGSVGTYRNADTPWTVFWEQRMA